MVAEPWRENTIAGLSTSDCASGAKHTAKRKIETHRPGKRNHFFVRTVRQTIPNLLAE
jgi:hypothetical protein